MEILEPIRDQVIIRPDLSDTAKKLKEADIELPSNAPETAKGRGIVVAAGPGEYQNGILIPMHVKVGETVLFTTYEDTREINGEKLHIVSERQIMAVVRTK